MSDIDSNLYFSNEPMGAPINFMLAQKKLEFYQELNNQNIPGAAQVQELYREAVIANTISKGGFINAALDAEQDFLRANPNQIDNFQHFLSKAKQEVTQAFNNQLAQKAQQQQSYASSPQGIAQAAQAEQTLIKVANQIKAAYVEAKMPEANIEIMKTNYDRQTHQSSGPITGVRLKFDDMEEMEKFRKLFKEDVQDFVLNGKFVTNNQNQCCVDISINQGKVALSVIQDKNNLKDNNKIEPAVQPQKNQNQKKSALPGLSTFEQIKKSAHSTFKDLRDSMRDVHKTVKSRLKK